MSQDNWSKDVTSIKVKAMHIFFTILLLAISSMAGMGSPDGWSPLYDIRLTQAMENMGLNTDSNLANNWSYSSIGAQDSTAHNAFQSGVSSNAEDKSVLHIMSDSRQKVMAATSAATCKPTCQSTCGSKATCISTCESTCRFTCRDTCISKATCRPTCQDTCQSTCKATCQSTCKSTCQSTCGAKYTCIATCQGTCRPTCMDTCVSKSTCRSTCQDTCKPTCQYTCASFPLGCCPNNKVYEIKGV